MLNPLKQQLKAHLTEAAQAGFKKLDKRSPLAREMKGLDVDAILKNDIGEICEVVSLSEMMKALSIVAAIKMDPNDAERHKGEIKSLARGLVARVEKKGTLLTPLSCRELLFNL